MSPYRLLAIVLLWCGVAGAFWYQLQGRQQTLRRDGRLFGAAARIVVFDHRPQRYAAAVERAFGEMARLEALTDGRRPGSEVARLSSSTGVVPVGPDLREILAEGLKVGAAGGGAFDMTLGRLRNLWGFDTAHPRRPMPEEIAAALADSGAGALALTGERLIKRTRARIDLDGIARGYIFDRAAQILEQAGVESAVIETVGLVRFVGRRATPWRLPVSHPRHPGETLATLVVSEAAAVVTVSDDTRFFLQNGVRYHPHFDPSTGMPAHACRSVSVISPRGVWAEALASAVFVLGPDKGQALLDRYPRTGGVILSSDGRITISSAIRDQVLRP